MQDGTSSEATLSTTAFLRVTSFSRPRRSLISLPCCCCPAATGETTTALRPPAGDLSLFVVRKGE